MGREEDDMDVVANYKGQDRQKHRFRKRCKKKLDNILFSRWTDGDNKTDGSIGTLLGWENFGGTRDPKERASEKEKPDNDDEEHTGNTNYDEVDRDTVDLADGLKQTAITGQEAWLDCLVSALERE